MTTVFYGLVVLLTLVLMGIGAGAISGELFGDSPWGIVLIFLVGVLGFNLRPAVVYLDQLLKGM